MRKKITIAMIISMLIINMLIPKYIFAEGEVGTLQDVMKHQPDIDQITGEGSATVTPDGGSERKEEIKETSTIGNTVGSAVTYLLTIPGQTIRMVLSFCIDAFQDQSKYTFNPLEDTFTIESLVMGRYTIFDIDVFNTNGNNETMNEFRTNIAKWYAGCWQIALAVGLLILIYLGIRMAISSAASEQAKYKKMLTSWITSIIILFFMHYFVIFFIELQKQIITLFEPLTKGSVGFEEYVMEHTWEALINAEGFNKVKYLILFYVMLYYQLKFAYLYFQRFLKIGFLTTISPLVTITYSIDKAGDNKAQAFSAWLKEIVINIFIQVLHAIVYLVFIFSAAEIAKEIPFFGIIFLMALSRAEKLVRKTFAAGGEGLSDLNIMEKLKLK